MYNPSMVATEISVGQPHFFPLVFQRLAENIFDICPGGCKHRAKHAVSNKSVHSFFLDNYSCEATLLSSRRGEKKKPVT